MSTAVLSAQQANVGGKLSYPEKLQTYLDNIAQYAQGSENINGDSGETIATSGPQGKVVPLTIVNDQADWTAESLRGKEDEYTWTLSKKDVDDIIHATNKITARLPPNEESVKDLKAEDYDWPEFAPKLIEAVKNVSLGRGFQLIRGFPVEHFRGNRFGLIVAFWGLGLVLGKPQVSQTDHDRDHKTFGSVLNHVANGRHTSVKGVDVYPQNRPADGNDGGERARKPRDEARLEFHSDQGATDLIALLSITKAKEGGESKWVSSVAIHNELLRRGRKDLVEALSAEGTWKVPHKIDQASYARNKDGKHTQFEDDPPFVYHDGYLSSHFASANYQEIDLTKLQQEAVWTFAAIAEDPKFHLSQTFEPGDIEIISNQVILHSRGDIVNGDAPHEKRHLIRWWIAQPKERNPRGVIPTFAPRSNVRPEGGFRFPGDDKSELRLPFYPYGAHDGEGQSDW